MLVVSSPDAGKAPPLQAILRVEGTGEDLVGGGQEGMGEVEEPLESPGPAG